MCTLPFIRSRIRAGVRLVSREAQKVIQIRTHSTALGLAVLTSLFLPPSAEANRDVTALGRLEPTGGVIHVSGPSRPGSVIAKLEIEEGDDVEESQILAVLDTMPAAQARVSRLEAELRDAKSRLAREETLRKTGATSETNLDSAMLAVDVAKAELAAANADLELSVVRSPAKARVLEVHAHRGERIGPEGLLELGRVDQMQAIAEVYETDIIFVKPGQAATIESPALPNALRGTVKRIGQKVGKLDVLGTDPAAVTDARVIEVEIALDDSTPAESLTNLGVEVRITSGQ